MPGEDLTVHERSQTGYKPFNCIHCKKAFASLEDLKVHERTHNKEKPLNCHHLNEAFVFGQDLKVHERTLTGEKPSTATNATELLRPVKICKCMKEPKL